MKLDEILEKLEEYEAVFGNGVVYLCLYADQSGNILYSTFDGTGVDRRIYSFAGMKEFLASNPMDIAKDMDFVRVSDK